MPQIVPIQDINIRTILPHDDAALARLIRQSLHRHGLALPGTAYFDPELDSLSSFYLSSPKRTYFVAADEQDLAVGGAGVAEFVGESRCAELQKLYLSGSAQGHGLGYRLISKALAFAENAGYEKLYIETHHFLSAANHIYRKMGFTELSAPLAGSQHGAMDIFYSKDLRKKKT